MTSDGWRCPTFIHKEQQLMAQELLSSHATAGSEVDIELIPRLVLCPGHAIGELPRMYAEKWADFSKQRLSKEEAMSKFNADFWMSIQFFSNEKRHDDTFRATSSNRPRTVSHLSSCSRNEYDFGSIERAGGTSRMPQVMPPWESATQNFEFVFLSRSPNSKTRAMPSRRDVLERPSSSDHPAFFFGTERQPQSVPEPVSINAQPVGKSPTLTTTGSSAFKKDSNEATSPEHNTKAQDTQAKIPKDQFSLHGNFQQNSRFNSQDIIDKELIEEMNARHSKGGYVHIFESPSRKLCKIGGAAPIYARRRQLQAGCQLQDFDHVTVTSTFTMFPQRVTKLVHLELQNFRAKLSCEGRHHPEFDDDTVRSEHREWFDVTSIVAMHSVFMWCEFTRLAYTSNGTIKEEWAERLTLLPKPSSVEISLLKNTAEGGNVPDVEAYHSERRKRYDRWIKEGSA
ncbi:hypothetical protein ACEPPN_005693 [Leptodophora sp. 'Broadleaf-Isolate-01']